MSLNSFTLLDDRDASETHPSSRLYTSLFAELVCDDAARLNDFSEQIVAALREGLHAVAVFSYEFGVALAGVETGATAPLPARVLLYRQCRQLSAAQVDAWLCGQGDDAPAGIAGLAPDVDEATFTRAIDRIRAYIAAGDTYQVNYTMRLHFQAYGSPVALYRRLRERQPVPYGALIALPDGGTLLSLSPELFLRQQGGVLFAQPMKGTAAAVTLGEAAEVAQVNAERARLLASDEKNRAENLMIVDLLRNDLGRIAQPGTVRAPQLFAVQRFNTVLQMTSTVQATLRDDATLADVLRAVYPCGSITGAPKHRTMQIIAELENAPRGVYTGAIGWFDPIAGTSRQAVPDFCLSVPIRTLHLQGPLHGEVRAGVMGVGAGIVYDSVPADEYQECLLKARFLTGLPAGVTLFETMQASRQAGCPYLDRHLQRLQHSAAFFGVPCDVAQIQHAVLATCAGLPDDLPRRFKLSLQPDGQTVMQTGALTTLATPVNVLLAPAATDSGDLWLRHKSTRRERYDEAWQEAERSGAFDMLFQNESGWMTEGGRCNVLVKLHGRWHTPPLADGVLPGVMRAVLMEDPAWGLTERQISRDDLLHAEQIAVCNALRGVMPARLA